MKKIININLAGRVIPIEDSAYEKLQVYIESLRRYFSREEDREEIINDIESRIAELMNEKIRKGSTCIIDADIEEIAASMGRPEDFDAVDDEPKGSATGTASASQDADTSYNYQTYSKKRLYRDGTDKMIGGVCSGLASYINIDPAIVRLLFAIITFGGFGFGVLVYILLWIVLPVRDLEHAEGKRLYRNPEERVIGGVASGLAAYFNKEAWVIRLIFAAPFILNIFFSILSWPFFHEGSFVPNIVFGSFSGTFIVTYIVLWIVLPEAKSTYQQMEMRGEKVDVNTIRQNVKEGTDSMKNKVDNWSKEVKESAEKFASRAKDFANTRGKGFAGEAGMAAGRVGRGLGHVIGVIFKAFFMFIAGTIAFALFVGLMGLLFGGVGVWPLKNYVLDGFWQNAFAWGTLILFLGVPLIAFIIWLLRRIMRVRSSGSYLGWTFGGLWTLGWVSAAFLVASLVHDFRFSNYRRPGSVLPITQPANGKLIVQVTEPEVEYSGTLPWIEFDGNGMDITMDTLRLANIRVRVESSNDSNYHVEVKKYSRGRNVQEAENRAQEIKMNVSYSDSILDIGSGIAIAKESKYRGQLALVIVRVPVGKMIRFDESIGKFRPFNIRIRERNRNLWERDYDFDYDEYFPYRTDVDYVMTKSGTLVDPTRRNDVQSSPQRDENHYRYRDDNTDVQDSIRQAEELRQELEEKKRNREKIENDIKELEKKQKESQRVVKTTRTRDVAMLNTSLPTFSLVKTFL